MLAKQNTRSEWLFNHSKIFVECLLYRASQVAQWSRTHQPMQGKQETRVQPLGQEDSTGERNSNLLQYSCLGNPEEAHSVAKSRMRLSDCTHSVIHWTSSQDL